MYKFLHAKNGDNDAKMHHFWKDGKRYVRIYDSYDSSYTEKPDKLMFPDENKKRNVSTAKFVKSEDKNTGEVIRLLRVTLKNGLRSDYLLAEETPFEDNAIVDVNSIGVYESDLKYSVIAI